MKKIIALLPLSAICFVATAQNELVNNGSVLQINTGCIIQVNGNLTNKAGSTLTNNGSVSVNGNITNDEVMTTPNTGTLEFKGTVTQSLNGAATFFAKHILLNNTSGVTLNTPLKVDGMATFNNGIMVGVNNATPLIFTQNGTVAGTSDASHINGFVVKEGTGIFTYPTGDGTKYQKVYVNLTANSAGMRVKYFGADAGAAPFTTAGSESTSLGGYNNKEYWDVTPIGTATGAVTIFWDGYKDAFGNYKSSRRVAHKTGGAWVNEGSNASVGNEFAGNLTSNNISTWSPFTLGSTAVILPLNLLQFTGTKQADYTHLTWATANEQNTKHFELESSTDGRSFTKIATVNAGGTGNHNYNYNDKTVYSCNVCYRLKMVDTDGKFTYSMVLLINQLTNQPITIYPNPATDKVYIKTTGMVNRPVLLTDAKGALLRTIIITQNQQAIDIQALPTGRYTLTFSDKTSYSFIKN